MARKKVQQKIRMVQISISLPFDLVKQVDDNRNRSNFIANTLQNIANGKDK